MSKCIFPIINALVSKKPIKYWRSFIPRDIPLKGTPILYYEWCDYSMNWEANLLAPIERQWSYNNIVNTISVHNRLLEKSKYGMVIIPVHPKFRIGKYNNITINKIFTIYPETLYLIFMDNHSCGYTVTESELKSMINTDKHIFLYEYKKEADITLYIRSKTNNPKGEVLHINEVLSKRDVILPILNDNPISINDTNDRIKWKYIRTRNISKDSWEELDKHDKPYIYNVNNILAVHLSLKQFENCYKERIPIKYIRNKRNPQESLKGDYSNVTEKIRTEEDQRVVVRYTTRKGYVIVHKVPKRQAEKLQGEHKSIEILTIPEYNKEQKKLRPIKNVNPTYNTIGSATDPKSPKLARKERRNSVHGKIKKYNRRVYTQTIPLAEEVDDENIQASITDSIKGKHPLDKSQTNVKGYKFITPSTICKSKMIKNGKIVDKTSTKKIYHYESSKEYKRKENLIITKHNLKKQKNRIPRKVSPELVEIRKNLNKTIDIPSSFKELREKYRSSDRRYERTTNIEKWSSQFFKVLKMVKDKERHKKILKYLIKECGYSEEWSQGFIRYLQLTKNGDPTKAHIRNTFKRCSRIKVTVPHVFINNPASKQELVIEHSVSDEKDGTIYSRITENVFAAHDRKAKRFLFYKIDESDKDKIIPVTYSNDVLGWVYAHEYNKDPEHVKWQKLVTSTTKEVDKIIKHKNILESRVKGSKVKKWITPIPPEKTTRYMIKKLLAVYKSGNHELLYSLIRNHIMEEYRMGRPAYDDIRKELYHHYSDLSQKLTTLIKANKMDDPDLVVFMEDLNHIHFN